MDRQRVATNHPTYFERVGPFRVLVATFLFLFVPLTALSVVPNYYPWVPYLVVIASIGLGVTHFFITPVLYLQSQNLDHFTSSARNRLIYFVAPVLIMTGFALLAALRAESNYPVFTLWFFAAIRLADFFHVGRQSYGMLQIWKHPAGDQLPRWLRTAENTFFVGMALLQLETYMTAQHFQGEWMVAVVPASALLGLFVAIAIAYLKAAGRGLGLAALRPLAYFSMQATCAGAAVYQTRLYLVALALHYVEYHMIMVPRCFYTPLSPERRLDRVSGLLRPHMLVFYALLLGTGLVFEGRNHLPTDLPVGTLFLVHLFDGIFVLHYFLEAFLWRFRSPYHREALLPLYARPWREIVEEARRAPNPPGAGVRSGLAVAGALLVGLGIAHATGALSRAAAYLQRTVGDPAYAEQQYEFGRALAKGGDLEGARQHLHAALDVNPGDQRARYTMMQIDQYLARQHGQ